MSRFAQTKNLLLYWSARWLVPWLKRPTLWCFIVLWLVILATPSLRLMLSVQTLGSTRMSPLLPWAERWEGTTFDAERLAQQHPNDWRAQWLRVDSNHSTGNWRHYEPLLKRYPDKPFLIAAYLHKFLTHFRDNRLAGDFDGAKPAPGVAAPEVTKEAPSFSKAELQRAIAIARQGQQHDPQNSFFDWTLAMFLYADYRDAEAFQVIATGSRKKFYDDYALEQARFRTEVYELARPLLLEEKIVISYSVLFPQFAKMRQLARDVSWQAWKMEQAGQHARAITLRADFARLCDTISRGRSTIIGALVEQACKSIIWSGNPQRRVRGGGAARHLLSARNFADYARTHGFAEVAHETLRFGQEGQQRHARIMRNMNHQTQVAGVPMARYNQIQGLWWLSMFCLLQIPFLLLFTIGQGFGLLGTRPEPRRNGDLGPLIATFLSTALVIGGLWLLFCADPQRAYSLMASMPEELSGLLFLSGLPFLFAWPILWAWLWCGLNLASRSWRERNAAESREEISTNPTDVLIKWVAWGFLLVMASCLSGALLFWQSTATVTLPEGTVITLGDIAPVLLLLGAMLTVVSYIGWFVKWRWLSPPRWQPVGHRLLHEHRRLLGNFLLVSSLFYVVLLLLAMPLRAEAERDWKTYLQRGEMAYVDQKVR